MLRDTMETRTFDYKGMKFTYYYSQGREGTIVLMHGYSFNSKVWEDIGFVGALNDLGLSVISIDMPGYPQSINKLALNESDMALLLWAMIGTLKGRVFLLGSSASCHVALEFAEERSDSLAGVIVVAPVSVKGITQGRISTRVLAVWGSEDDISPAYKNEDAIKSIKGAQVEIIKDAGHACYLRQPEAFIRIISEFISNAK